MFYIYLTVETPIDTQLVAEALQNIKLLNDALNNDIFDEFFVIYNNEFEKRALQSHAVKAEIAHIRCICDTCAKK